MPNKIRSKSDFHYFLFFFCGNTVRFLDELVGDILYLFLAELEIVLGYFAVLLHLLELFHAVSADRANGNLAVLRQLLDILDYVAALILGQGRESKSYHLSVVLRVNSEIGGLDSLLDGMQSRNVPGLNAEDSRLNYRDSRKLIYRGGSAVIINSYPIENRRGSSVCSYRTRP